jgi:hypothetical protein
MHKNMIYNLFVYGSICVVHGVGVSNGIGNKLENKTNIANGTNKTKAQK